MALELIAQLYMVCVMVDYKRQVYFCNAVYEKFIYVINMALIDESNQEMYTLKTNNKTVTNT